MLVVHSEHCGEAIWLNTAEPAHESVELVGIRNKNPQAFGPRVNTVLRASIYQLTLLALTAG